MVLPPITTASPTSVSPPGSPRRRSVGNTRSSSRAPRREETENSEKAGRAWARSVDDPWWPCILTLDGGGIRGYSSLLILKALMHEIWIWEQFYDSPEGLEQLRSESPTAFFASIGEASASRSSEGVMQQSGSHRALNNDPDAAEARHGVETDVTAPPVIPASVASLAEQDRLTADLSKRKALSEEELLPCHYFDFMYGTSTGGLIATILGRLRMTVTEGLELYRQVGEDLFGRRRSSMPFAVKYYHEPLERAVRDLVGSRCRIHPNCDGNDLHPWDPFPDPDGFFDVDDPRVCHSCCLTATHDQHIIEAYLLRTYPHYYSEDAPNWITRYNEGADPLPIWTVMRATTAAPFYFDMVRVEVDGEEKLFKDGGIRENNPSGAALSEFLSMYQDKAPSPALLLSVGTGRPNQAHDGFVPTQTSSPLGRIAWINNLLGKFAVIQNLLVKYTEGERQHHQLRDYARGEHTWYKRLNAAGLETMSLDEWERGLWRDPSTGEERVIPGGSSLTKMEHLTREYLQRGFDPLVDSYARPETMLTQAAQKLVLQRRAREAEGGPRWETFVGR